VVRVAFRYEDDDRDARHHYDGATVYLTPDPANPAFAFTTNPELAMLVNGIAVTGYLYARRNDPPHVYDDGSIHEWSHANYGHIRRLDGKETTDNMRAKIHDAALAAVIATAAAHPEAIKGGRLATLQRHIDSEHGEIKHLDELKAKSFEKLHALHAQVKSIKAGA
jgi:hypothetical protein